MCLGGTTEALKIVVVDRGYNVGAAERGRHHHGLPGGAFLHPALAEHDIIDPIGLAAALRHRHPNRHGEPMAQRAGRSLDTGIAIVRMDAKAAIGLAVSIEILASKYSVLFQDHVLDHAAMTLRHEESVRRGAIETAAHQPMIHAIDNLGARIGRSDVQSADLLRYVQDAAPIAKAARIRCFHIERVESHHLVHGLLTPASTPATLSARSLSLITQEQSKNRRRASGSAGAAGCLGAHSMMVQ